MLTYLSIIFNPIDDTNILYWRTSITAKFGDSYVIGLILIIQYHNSYNMSSYVRYYGLKYDKFDYAIYIIQVFYLFWYVILIYKIVVSKMIL